MAHAVSDRSVNAISARENLCRISIFEPRLRLSSANGFDAAGTFLGAHTGFVCVLPIRQRNAHPAAGKTLRLAEQAQIAFGDLQCTRHAFEGDTGFFQTTINDGRCTRLATSRIDRQAEDCTRVQFKFRLTL